MGWIEPQWALMAWIEPQWAPMSLPPYVIDRLVAIPCVGRGWWGRT